MRTKFIRLDLLDCLVAGSLLAAPLTGCVWSTFDDLKDDIWVDSRTKPSGVNSSKYGEAIVGIPTGNDGALIAVLGRTEPSLSTIAYDINGTAATERTTDVLVNQIALGDGFNFPEHPAFAGDPGSTRVALGAVTKDLNNPDLGDIKIAVFDATDLSTFAKYEPAVGSLLSGKQAVNAVAFAGPTHVAVAREDQVVLVDTEGMADHELTACDLPPGEGAFAVGFGDFGLATRLIAEGEILVATAPVDSAGVPTAGEAHLWAVSGGFSETPDDTACEPVVGADLTGLTIDHGTQIIVADFGNGPRVLVSAPGDNGEIRVIDFAAAPPVIEHSIPVPDLSSMAVGDLDGDGALEIIAGAANVDADGVANSGTVTIFSSTTFDLITDPLHDADPIQEQHFGKSVAAVPFTVAGETRYILSVGAEGEVFTYFRTTFYPEVRAGRD